MKKINKKDIETIIITISTIIFTILLIVILLKLSFLNEEINYCDIPTRQLIDINECLICNYALGFLVMIFAYLMYKLIKKIYLKIKEGDKEWK